MIKYTPPPPPPAKRMIQVATKNIFFFFIQLLLTPSMIGHFLFNFHDFSKTIANAFRSTLKRMISTGTPEMINEIWETINGQSYLKGGLEFQPTEGYCAPTTVRIILKSIPLLDPEFIPTSPMKGGGASPEAVAKRIDECSNGKTQSTLVFGSQGYADFLDALRLSSNPHYRISCNFLRSAVCGIPFNSAPILSIFYGGHFSPIVGYIEEKDLVAVFDVNYSFGLFFVNSRDLFNAVNTVDIFARKTRALVLTKVLGEEI